MVEIVGAGTAVHCSPKDLGLDVRFLGLFWAVSRLVFGLLSVHILFLCVIANMNNMLVVCTLCYYMHILYINMNLYENGISHFKCMGTP